MNKFSHIDGHSLSRNILLIGLLLAATTLAGCASHIKPPEISYDDAAPAMQTIDPPAPVKVVELPKPLPLPGQLMPVPKSKTIPEPREPTARIASANAAARIQPVPKLPADFPWFVPFLRD